MTKVWHAYNSMNNSKSWAMINWLRTDDLVVNDDREIANVLGKQFSQVSSNSNYDPIFYRDVLTRTDSLPYYPSQRREECDELPINLPFSYDEFTVALGHRKSTAPGQDEICYPMVTNLSKPCQNKLLGILNDLWKKGVCPETWRHSIIIPLLKYGKPPQKPSSYWPICLTSVLCKLMERMITKRLKWFLENTELLHPAQCGFRSKRSTKDCLMRLHDDIYKSISNRRFSVAIFLDLEKAYDMVWRNGLLHKLRKLGIRGNILSRIDSFLQSRTFQVRVGSTLSNTFTQENGIPKDRFLAQSCFLL